MTSRVANNGAFLHIPKTGGSWIFKVLGDAGIIGEAMGGHEHSPNHREQWAFTVVRNPVEWWISLWKERMGNGWEPFNGGEMHPLYELQSVHEPDVGRWIHRAATEFPGFAGRLFQRYTRNAKYVLRTDLMAEQLPILAERAGWRAAIDFKAPKVNVSQRQAPPGIDISPVTESEAEAVQMWIAAKSL